MLISDKEAFSKSHKAADECFHGLFTHREEENCRAQSRHSQCRDFQAAGKKVSKDGIKVFTIELVSIEFRLLNTLRAITKHYGNFKSRPMRSFLFYFIVI